jgi:hypothetical protein
MMTVRTRKVLLKIATENAETLYSGAEGAEGLWVSNDQLASDFEEEEYEDFLTPERLEEIQSGQSFTDDEIQALREQRLEKWLSGDADADVVPGYCFAEVTDTDRDRGTALLLCTGYSFSGLSIWVEGIFDNRAAAMAYMEENGSTSAG